MIARPKLTFPAAVSDWVREHYDAADVILEYGSGGSTALAADLPGKRVFSVESDPDWTGMMQDYLDGAETKSPVTMHYADIGPVGKWGRPVSHEAWFRYHLYPNSIWDDSDFEAPDLVLIDGRFRAACFLTVLLRTEKPVTVLFDDYVGRRAYKVVESWVKPVEIRERMAKFIVEPFEFRRNELTKYLKIYTNSF